MPKAPKVKVKAFRCKRCKAPLLDIHHKLDEDEARFAESDEDEVTYEHESTCPRCKQSFAFSRTFSKPTKGAE